MNSLEAVAKFQDLCEDTLERFRRMSSTEDKLMLAAITLRYIADYDLSEILEAERVSFSRERVLN